MTRRRKKTAGWQRKADIAQALRIPRLTAVRLQERVLLVDVIGAAVQNVHVLAGGEKFAHGTKRAGIVDVIAVEPTDEIAGRECESLVDRVSLTFVWFGSIPKPIRVPFEDLDRSVARTTVDDAMYSRSAISWSRTLRTVRSMNATWLYQGVTTENESGSDTCNRFQEIERVASRTLETACSQSHAEPSRIAGRSGVSRPKRRPYRDDDMEEGRGKDAAESQGLMRAERDDLHTWCCECDHHVLKVLHLDVELEWFPA